jgi:hypothetical protein
MRHEIFRLNDRKAKALEAAREFALKTLSAVGLGLDDLVKGKETGLKGPVYKVGFTYQHPSNKSLVWNAKGQKPKWLREVEADGNKPVEPPQKQ